MSEQQSVTTMLAGLDQQLDRPVIDWEPAAGERIIGVVEGFDYVTTAEGVVLGIVLLDAPNGAQVRVAAGSKSLRGQLERTKVQPGDGLGILYEGAKKAKSGGRDYNAYRVVHQAVGERNPAAAFNVPERVADDDGLINGAANAAWPPAAAATDGGAEPPF